MRLTILQGDVFARLPELPAESIDLVLTSPPYWGLRDYGIEGQLGAEPTMEAYLDNMLRWVKEIWRVLKPTGSFVLNIGDCFIGSGIKDGKKSPSLIPGQLSQNTDNFMKLQAERKKIEGLGVYKPKQLLSVSSFAYCRIISETDFICRGEHIWCKPNVPSPIRSRLKHSHEKLFWFVKDADKYYFDARAWLKPEKISSKKRCEGNYFSTAAFANQINLSPTSCYRGGGDKARSAAGGTTIEHSWRVVPVGARQSGFELSETPPSEHIAPFPEALIRPYLKSLCPLAGTILDPFLGSGTTMRVAMEEERNCIGIELSEKYVQYAKKRLNWGGGLGVEYAGDLSSLGDKAYIGDAR